MTQVIENKELLVETLKKRSDFLRVADRRKKWITPAMIIQTAPASHDDIRVGYTASKKVGNAVARNRAKRIMREIVRHVIGSFGKTGHDYVLIARREINERSFKELIRDLKWSLKRLHEGDAEKGAKKRERTN